MDPESRAKLRAVMAVKVPSEAVLLDSNFALINTFINTLSSMTYAALNGKNEIAMWPVCTQSLEISPRAAKGMLRSMYAFTPVTQLGGKSVSDFLNQRFLQIISRSPLRPQPLLGLNQ